MADGALEPLLRAVDARRRGISPDAADIKACERAAFKGELSCWNGKRPDRPACPHHGSQNIPVYAAAGLADWDWIAALCELESKEGDFGREHGSPGAFYYGGLIGIKLLAQGNLLRDGKTREAELCRLSVRSSLAWSVITALPVARLLDEINYAGKIETATAPKILRHLAVAFSGMRWSVRGRAVTLAEDSPSETLAAMLGTRDDRGLTVAEAGTMWKALTGDVEAAREVSSWMYGTIETPDTTWSWRLRRTTLGTESVFTGKFPNPMKPMMVASQLSLDGTWRGMRPSPQLQNNNWATGFEVHIDDGVIHSSCAGGKAELPELGGAILWQVDVVGQKVTFSA